MKNDIIIGLYKDPRTVFRLTDIALLVDETNYQSLSKKLNYHVKNGKIQNPRRGIYTKPEYNREELACLVYTPSYISLEYVLQKEGVLFQYSSEITVVSYLSRTINISERNYRYRRIKGEILVHPGGIKRRDNNINIASAERAFLDLLYLSKTFYFDNLNLLDKSSVFQLLPYYQSKTLTNHVKELLK